MRHTTKILALAAMLTASAWATAQGEKALPIDKQVRYGRLDNGLTYYIQHSENPRERANFYIVQKVGSVQEEEDQRGLAHFLEHMCFNGTKHFEGNTLLSYCASIGVKFGQNLNAYTSTDETVYNIDDVPVTEGHIDTCLLILRDWSDGLLLLPEEIDKERGVIHEEWRMGSGPEMRIVEKNLETIYPGSKYGRRLPIGLMSVVDNFKPQVLRDYYEKWYRPDLQGVVVVGDIDVKDIEKRIIKTFGDIEMPEKPGKFEYYEVPDNEEAIYAMDSDKELTSTQISILYKTKGLTREQRATETYYRKEYINDVMCGMLNTRLGELKKKGDCPFVEAYCSYGNYLLSGTRESFEVDIVTKEGRSAEALRTVLAEIERARRHGFVGSEIKRAREQFMTEHESAYENRENAKNAERGQKLIRRFLDNRAIAGDEKEHEIYKKLEKQIGDEVFSETIKEYTASTGRNFVVTGMYTANDKMPTAEEMRAAVGEVRAMEIAAYVDDVDNRPLIAELPARGKIVAEKDSEYGYKMWELSNGARVFYKKTNFSKTEVVFKAVSIGGLRQVDDEHLAAAKAFNDIARGTGLGDFTLTELEKKLAGKQIELEAQLRYFNERLNGLTTPKDLETLIQLVHLAFQEPANDTEGYNSCMNELREKLSNKDKDPSASFGDTVMTTLYRHNPRLTNLTLEELDRVRYEDVREVYRQRFQSASDFDFFFTGNIEVGKLREYVEKYIASLPRKAAEREKLDKREGEVTYYKGEVVNEYRKRMETPQAVLLQFWQGDDEYSLKESLTVTAASEILTSRYLKTIREEAGIAYHVGTTGQCVRTTEDISYLQTVCPFKPEEKDKLLELLDKTIEDIVSNGVSEKELEDVKKFLQKQFNDNQRSNAYWQNLVVDKTLINVEGWADYKSTLKKLSVKDVRQFVEKMKRDGNRATIILLPEI